MKDIEFLASEIDKIDQQISDLQKPIAEKVFALQKEKQILEDDLNQQVYLASRDQLINNDYGCGTANIETASFKFKTVVSKGVKWDEDVLRQIANQIRSAGQDPETYIKYKLSVSETDFKKFPENIKQAFVPARTVEPSKPKITWEKK